MQRDRSRGTEGVPPTLEDPVDLALVSRLRERDPEALREVIAAHGGCVLATARRVLRDNHLAQEVCQETLLALWQRPDMFEAGRGSLRALLVRIARNKAIDVVRREESARRRADASVVHAHDLVAGSFDDALELRLDTKKALGALSAEQKQAVFLAYFAGLTYRDVARVLGLPEGTVKTRIRDGMTRMRLILA